MAQINGAESNRAILRIQEEVVWGTTPTSGSTRELRFKSSDLVASKETKTSDEIRADRMVPSIIETAASSGGGISGEFSAGTYDDLFQGFLLGTWSRVMNHWLVKGVSVTVTGSSQITIVGRDWTDFVADNQFIKLEGFTNEANNGYFSINGAPTFSGGNTVITVDETTLVAEGGSAFTKALDASDVILKSTLTAFQAGNTINGGGANAFVGQTLEIGQKIFVEGLGKETGTIVVDSAPADGDKFIISDGVASVTFEFNNTEAAVGAGNVFLQNTTDTGVAAVNIKDGINGQFVRQSLRVTASESGGTKESGSFAFATTAEVGDQLTVNDGELAVQFTFVASGGTGTNVNVGVSANASSDNLQAAIAASALNVTGVSVVGTLTITNNNFTGGALTEQTDTGLDITTTNFSAGVKPDVLVVNHRQTGGSITETVGSLSTTAFAGGDANKSGFFTIASLPDDDTIVVTEPLTIDANAGARAVVIKGAHLRNPGTLANIKKRSFSIETGFSDVSKYFLMNGQRVGSFSMEVNSGDLVSIDWGFQGRATVASSVSTLGNSTTYTTLPTTDTEVLNATSNIGSILKDGVVLTKAIQSISIEGDSNLREQRAVSSKFPCGIGYGRFLMNGKLVAYFEDLSFYNDFINHTTLGLEFNFEDVDHLQYVFRIPSIKITSDPISPGGIDEDILEEMDWTAQRDGTLNTQFMIDRFSSVYPASATA